MGACGGDRGEVVGVLCLQILALDWSWAFPLWVWLGWGGVWGCGGGPVRCPKSRAGRGVRASLTEVYPAGKLQ